MLCEISSELGFFAIWMIMTALGLLSMLVLSGSLFYLYYWQPSFEQWQYKSNPKFPSPLLVKKEIIHMCKGLIVATLCPAFTLAASSAGWSHGYCGLQSKESGMSLYAQAAVVFFFTDFYEYVYHAIGHYFSFFWEVHRHHHRFYNPSPFAVIADEYLDQFVRTWPMVILPAITPINIDLLFLIFATLFYGYGVYLHWGYESPYLTAHNPIFNSAYHHYIHHAVSAKNRAIYTGFFFKLWDNVFNTLNPGPCQCYSCRPVRTREDWNKISKPDYSVLLSFQWWMTTDSNALGNAPSLKDE
jgi:lathosterol oxidase